MTARKDNELLTNTNPGGGFGLLLRHYWQPAALSEELARRFSTDGQHLYGAGVTLADICLVPQIYNAHRVDCDLSAFPTLLAISATLEALPAFSGARPEAQPDAA